MSQSSENEKKSSKDETNTGHGDRNTPGQVLSAAREQSGKTQSDIAKQLHLSPEIIKAIESDEYDRTPSLIYMRGYVRAYAKYLDIPEAEILKAFDALGLKPKQDQNPLYKINPGSIVKGYDAPYTGKKSFARWAGLVLALILITLVVLWWKDGSVDHLTSNQQAASLLKTSGHSTVGPQPIDLQIQNGKRNGSSEPSTTSQNPSNTVTPPVVTPNANTSNLISPPNVVSPPGVAPSPTTQANNSANNSGAEVPEKPKPRAAVYRNRKPLHNLTSQNNIEQEQGSQNAELKPNFTIGPVHD